MEHKMGVITHRTNTIITEEENVLSIAGFSKWAWQAPGKRKLHPHPHQRDCIWHKGHVTSPYVRGITEPIRRLIKKTGHTAHTKPHTTIRKLLVAPKEWDKLEDKCLVVYNLSCQDCDAYYVGETEQPHKHCIKEHSTDSSLVGHHMDFHQHKLDTDIIKMLDRERRWFQRGVQEALQICSSSPSLNRYRGRHHLPSPI